MLISREIHITRDAFPCLDIFDLEVRTLFKNLEKKMNKIK